MRGGENGAVDADDFAPQVEQRPAGIPLVHGGVGLQKLHAAVGDRAAAFGADDALRHRFLQTEGIAHGEHHLSHAHGVAVAERERHDVGRGDLQDGDVGHFVRADELRRQEAAVGQLHLDFFHADDDVMIGQDVAFLGNDDPGTHGLLRARREVAEKKLERILRLRGARAGDADDGRHHGGDEPRVFRIERREHLHVLRVDARTLGGRVVFRAGPAARGERVHALPAVETKRDERDEKDDEERAAHDWRGVHEKHARHERKKPRTAQFFR